MLPIGADQLAVALDLAPAHGGETEQRFAARAPGAWGRPPRRTIRAQAHAPLRLAKAIWRERTQDRTSGVGGIGAGALPQLGQLPNFCLNWWAIHPGL